MSKQPNQNSWVNSLEPVNSISELSEPFLLARTPETEFLVGIELEHFLVEPDSLRLIPFDGDRGIEKVLKELVSRYNWNGKFEVDSNGKKRLIALSRDELSVTLEPAGGMELVSDPVSDLKCIEKRIIDFRQELLSICQDLKLGLLECGYAPVDTLDSLGLVPKSRYGFMYPYMKKVGTRGQEMMKLTSSIQVSIDFATEADACRKLRLATQATPFLLALSANSRWKQGEETGLASDRALVWQETDNDRAGIPDFFCERGITFSDYIEWALDVPIYFLLRGEKLIHPGGMNFRQYLESGYKTKQANFTLEATKGDWEQHLSTLFPWVRFRHYVEIRAFDMAPLPFQMAAGALCKGLFYCERALSQLETLIGSNDGAFTREMLEVAARGGVKDSKIAAVSMELLEIASECLGRHSLGENSYLKAYRNLLQKNKALSLPELLTSK